MEACKSLCLESKQPSSKIKKKSRVGHVAQGQLLMATSSKASDKLNDVLAALKDDEVGLQIKGDLLLIMLGEQMVSKHGHERQKHCYIGTL